MTALGGLVASKLHRWDVIFDSREETSGPGFATDGIKVAEYSEGAITLAGWSYRSGWLLCSSEVVGMLNDV